MNIKNIKMHTANNQFSISNLQNNYKIQTCFFKIKMMKLKVISFKINQFFLGLLINIKIKIINQILNLWINFQMSNTINSSFHKMKWVITVKTILFINNNQNYLSRFNQAFLKIITTLNSRNLFGWTTKVKINN